VISSGEPTLIRRRMRYRYEDLFTQKYESTKSSEGVSANIISDGDIGAEIIDWKSWPVDGDPNYLKYQGYAVNENDSLFLIAHPFVSESR